MVAELDKNISAAPKTGIKPRRTSRAFNGLTPREWTRMSRNVWNDVSSPRHPRHLLHGAVFPEKLADRVIRLYSDEGDTVFDPFLGIGTTVVAAMKANRRGIGLELSATFAEVAESWIREESGLFIEPTRTKVIVDDSRNLRKHVERASVQLTFTSPPYANFIRRSVDDRAKTHKTSRIVHANNSRVKAYSDDDRDLGNLPYSDFLEACGGILEATYDVTRPGGYAVWVVKDYRLPPDQPYVPFHSDLPTVAQRHGWLWHDLITWDQNEQRSLVLLGFPSRFYTNQNCSFLVVMRKPN